MSQGTGRLAAGPSHTYFPSLGIGMRSVPESIPAQRHAQVTVRVCSMLRPQNKCLVPRTAYATNHFFRNLYPLLRDCGRLRTCLTAATSSSSFKQRSREQI